MYTPILKSDSLAAALVSTQAMPELVAVATANLATLPFSGEGMVDRDRPGFLWDLAQRMAENPEAWQLFQALVQGAEAGMSILPDTNGGDWNEGMTEITPVRVRGQL